jgi:hypothetical protein
MERETPQPGPPKVPKTETLKPPSSTERTGLFERWAKKDKKPPSAEAKQAKPEASAEVKEAQKPARKKIGEFIFGLFAAKPPAAETQSETPVPPTPETAEQPPVVERATRARRFARLVINRVMNTARAESAQPRPLDTEPLEEAAEDLHEADQELGETLDAAQTTGAEFGAAAMAGFETAAELVTGSVTAARIVERVNRLEEHAEHNRATAIAAVGLGVIAVLVAGHEYFGKKRIEKKLRGTEKTVREQGDQLAQQETQFAHLRQGQERVTAMNRTGRQEYYDRLSQFTHKQAEVTRGITREVQQAEQPISRRAEWQPIRTPETAPTPEPLARVETADKIERGPSKSDHASGQFIGGSAAGGIPGAPVQGQEELDKAPLSPAALREQAARAARLARLRSNAWLYGLTLAGAGAVVAALLIFG